MIMTPQLKRMLLFALAGLAVVTLIALLIYARQRLFTRTQPIVLAE